jgi:probable addiction module antidote protein
VARTSVATKPFDSAEYLDTPDVIAASLQDIFGNPDPALIAHGLGVVARAKGLASIAENAGLSRETLYRP